MMSVGHHQVMPGDTLWAIAQANGITVSELVTANRVSDPNLIGVGWVLHIPAPVTAEPEPTPEPEPEPEPTPEPTPAPVDAPHTPPQPGPDTAPDGFTTVPAGDNTNISFSSGKFWFAPGVHTNVNASAVRDNAEFVGAPGAVIDGQGNDQFAIQGDYWEGATGVHIAHLEIRGYQPPNQQGVLNQRMHDGWTIEHCWIHDNNGAAVMGGHDLTIRHNKIDHNGQYALNGFRSGGDPERIRLVGNEIAHNGDSEDPGQHGGFKFWAGQHCDVVDNWVHHNVGAGCWMDNNNNDFLIEHNLIEDNTGQGIWYETSYNATIRGNTIRRNLIGTGQRGWPDGAIYISESGGDDRLDNRTGGKLEITGNVFEDNWSGVTLWENADRFSGSPGDTSGTCNLVMQQEHGGCSNCAAGSIEDEPYTWDCRWRTQNVDIHHNEFRHNPANVTRGGQQHIAKQAVFSNWGTWPDWSPYHGDVIQQAITFDQANSWHDNTYEGEWEFVVVDSGQVVSWEQWRADPFNQDEGSTFDA